MSKWSTYTMLLVLSTIFGLHLPVHAAILEVGSSTSCNTGTPIQSTLTCAHDAGTGANRMTIVGVAMRLPGTPSLVRYNGVDMTLLISHPHATSGLSCWIYYLPNPSLGTNDVVVNVATSTRYIVGAITFSGVQQTSPWRDSDIDETNEGTSLTAPTLTTSANDVLIDTVAMSRSDEGTFVPGANQSTPPEWANVTTDIAGNNVRAAASTQLGSDGGVMSWSWTSPADVVMCVGSLMPAVPTGGEALQPILQ